MEQCYIALYDTVNPSKGYNISLGGESTNGLKHTEITKKRISKSHKGKSHSKETKKKMSENHANVSGRNNPSAKSIICITTGLLFFTIKEASEYYNIDKSSIAKCCKGKIKYCGKLSDGTKLVWRYVNYKHNKVYRVINR